MIEKGTLNDKITAMQQMITENPSYCLKYLQMLANLSKKNDRKTKNLCFEALIEVFKTQLKYEKGNANEEQRNLITEYFDLTVKYIYNEFVENLKHGLNDDLEFFRKLCIGFLGDLAKSQPVNFKDIVSAIVRKLGDNSSRVCQFAI